MVSVHVCISLLSLLSAEPVHFYRRLSRVSEQAEPSVSTRLLNGSRGLRVSSPLEPFSSTHSLLSRETNRTFFFGLFLALVVRTFARLFLSPLVSPRRSTCRELDKCAGLSRVYVHSHCILARWECVLSFVCVGVRQASRETG